MTAGKFPLITVQSRAHIDHNSCFHLQGHDGESSPITAHRKRSAVRIPSAGNQSDLLSRTTVRVSVKGSPSQGTLTGLAPSPGVNRSNISQASLSSGTSSQSARSTQKSDKYACTVITDAIIPVPRLSLCLSIIRPWQEQPQSAHCSVATHTVLFLCSSRYK